MRASWSNTKSRWKRFCEGSPNCQGCVIGCESARSKSPDYWLSSFDPEEPNVACSEKQHSCQGIYRRQRHKSSGDDKDANAAVDLGRIRKEVMALLEKYDKDKLDRIDIIVKDELLMDKMKQRYESGAAAAGSIANLNLQLRSEMALQRHRDRMQKKLEQHQLQHQQHNDTLGN